MTAMAVHAPHAAHVPHLSWPRVGAWSGSFSLHIVVLALLLIPPVALQLKRAVPPPPTSARIIEVTPPPPAVPEMPTIVRHQAPVPVRRLTPPAAIPVEQKSEMAMPLQIAETPPAIESKPTVQDSEPSAITYGQRTRVAYPKESLINREQGTVVLRVLVGVDGLPQAIEIEKSSGYLRLDRAARDAVKGWTFHPAIRGGVASSAWALVPVTFNLQNL